MWEFPGGRIEFGEHPEDAAVRETKEETGLDVNSTGILSIGSTVTPQGKHHICFCYKCKIMGGSERVLDEDHDVIGWFSLGEMEKLPDLALSAKAVLSDIKNYVDSS